MMDSRTRQLLTALRRDIEADCVTLRSYGYEVAATAATGLEGYLARIETILTLPEPAKLDGGELVFFNQFDTGGEG